MGLLTWLWRCLIGACPFCGAFARVGDGDHARCAICGKERPS